MFCFNTGGCRGHEVIEELLSVVPDTVTLVWLCWLQWFRPVIVVMAVTLGS